MNKVWLLRGVAAAVFVALSGAWAVGFANGGGGAPAPKKDDATPATADASAEDAGTDLARPVVLKKKHRKGPKASPSAEAAAEPAAVPGEVDATQAVAPKTATPQPTKSPKPRKPRTSAPPSPSSSPSKQPSPQPSQQCTDLPSAVNCVLAPVTSHP